VELLFTQYWACFWDSSDSLPVVVPTVDPDGGPCWVTVETATDSLLGSQLDLLSTWTWACYCWVSFSVSLVGLVFGVLPARCCASYLWSYCCPCVGPAAGNYLLWSLFGN
jgi:hypothetical protein